MADKGKIDAVLPDPQTAFQTLFDGVHQRVFFTKLAQIRPQYMPQNEKQAADLLDLAGKLRLVDQEAAVKSASEANDPFAAANAALDYTLQQHGFTSVQNSRHREEALSIKQAAFDMASDPDIYNAVLALKAHDADQYAAQLQHQ